MNKCSRVSALISLDAVEENFEQMRKNLNPETKMIAVVKTDAYGHGAMPIARLMEPKDYLWGFAVASVEEAMRLRQGDIKKPILILGYTFDDQYDLIAKNEIRPAVFTWEMAKALSDAAAQAGSEIPIHLALDTGMTRIGFADTESSADVIAKIADLPGIRIEGMFTHFAKADETDKAYANMQFERYQNFAKLLSEKGVQIPLKHCANSAAILELPYMQLDMVRAGITMYGIYPSDEVSRESIRLRPVMELKSHIAYVKEVGPGVPVSYGGTYITDKVTKIATIPVGYGDGYPRSLSNKGYVLIHGKKAPILGRVCMDQFMVDVTDLDAKINDEVVLMGESEGSFLSIDELGHLSGRFPYEFVCDLQTRIPRIYYYHGEITEITQPHA